MEKGNIHALYKNLGESPLDCINRFKITNPEYVDMPMTYAGRLDPMAEGLLLVLSGEAVHEKEKFLDLPKTYVFEVLWGFETDTLDLLGRVVESEKLKVEGELKIQEILEKSVGRFSQKYPAYSSKPVNGKPLFEWAREGRIAEVEIPEHEVEVYSAKFVSRREISKEDLLKGIEEKISKVSGDFRQKEVLASWQEVCPKTVFGQVTIDTLEVTVSSGFYVRQFVSDLAQKLGLRALTFHIKRTKIGEYNLNGL